LRATALSRLEELRGSWFRETRGGPAPPDKERHADETVDNAPPTALALDGPD
jgi:hypothetical protein